MTAQFVRVKSRYSLLGPRILIQIPKRVGVAPRRNRAKRIIREWFRQNLDALPSRDFLIFVKKKLDISRQEMGKKIREELDKLLLD